MRPPPSSSPSSIPPTSSVSIFERYEKMFNGCGGCVADDEQEPVASAILYQQSSDETDAQPSTLTTEAISNCNWSSSTNKARRHQQESPPSETTVTYNQASFNEIDKFDIDERRLKRLSKSKTTQAAKTKAQTEEAAVNDEYFHRIKKLPMVIPASPTMLTPQQRSIQASQILQMSLPASPTTIIMTQGEEEAVDNDDAYFHQIKQKLPMNIHDSNQSQIQMALPASPSTMMTQQQRRIQQHCHHATPIQSKKTVLPTSKQPLSSSPKTRLQQYDMFQVVMPRSFRSSLTGPAGQHRHHEGGSNLQYTDDSDSTQSTQSLSESDDDISWGPEDAEPQEQQDTLVSILRVRKVKLGTTTETKTTDTNRGRVRFDQDTKFPDPTERPSPTRKHVPRMSQRQKQEYQLNNYYPQTTVQQRRQLDLSSLLMAAAAAGPSPLDISSTPTNNHEFGDCSTTANKNSLTNNMSRHYPEIEYRQQQRSTQKAQQKQYQYRQYPHHQRSHSSAVNAEELFLSHYY